MFQYLYDFPIFISVLELFVFYYSVFSTHYVYFRVGVTHVTDDAAVLHLVHVFSGHNILVT